MINRIQNKPIPISIPTPLITSSIKRAPSLARALVLGLSLVTFLFFFSSIFELKVNAQPPFPIIYEGSAFIGIKPAPDGTKIDAKVGIAESRPAIVKDGKYSILVVDPSLQYEHSSDVVGLTIQFFANGIPAVETDLFVEGQFLEKALDLNFPELPKVGGLIISPARLVQLSIVGITTIIIGLLILRVRRKI